MQVKNGAKNMNFSPNRSIVMSKTRSTTGIWRQQHPSGGLPKFQLGINE
jgi:hypothetical protein